MYLHLHVCMYIPLNFSLASWERKNGKEHGNYYNGLISTGASSKRPIFVSPEQWLIQARPWGGSKALEAEKGCRVCRGLGFSGLRFGVKGLQG